MNTLTKVERRRRVIGRYLERRQLYPFQIATKPGDDLGLVVVIPCFDEPDLIRVLTSLSDCARPRVEVEVIFVVNAPEGASRSVLHNNARSAQSIAAFVGAGSPDWLNMHAIVHNDLPLAAAGVGLARKLGMDEAVGRIAQSRNARGIVASLDADCRVAKNYLTELEAEFMANPDCPGISIYFEHDEHPEYATAITEYELHLRYYVAGQRGAGFPYAFHTIGSAMACRAEAYAAQGGMNRRQGGEDFYFAQKLIALGGFRAATGTCVYPAARPSERVPFGTGPAVRAAAGGEARETFPPEVFKDLERVCAAVAGETPSTLFDSLIAVSPAMNRFLIDQDFPAAFAEICANVNSGAALRRRFYRWFNAFRFLKFAQHVVRTERPRVPVARAATILAESRGLHEPGVALRAPELLAIYRREDRLAGGPGAPLG